MWIASGIPREANHGLIRIWASGIPRTQKGLRRVLEVAGQGLQDSKMISSQDPDGTEHGVIYKVTSYPRAPLFSSSACLRRYVDSILACNNIYSNLLL